MEKPNRPLGINESMHALLTAAVGCYLFVIAYKVFTGGEKDGIAPALAVVLGVFFALAGAGALYYAWRIWRKSRRKPTDAQDGEAEAPSADEEIRRE